MSEREVWWIFSQNENYGGLRIGFFSKTVDGTTIVVIQGESDRRRIGVRTWADIQDREGWVKVEQIAVPNSADILAATDRRLREIAREITEDVERGR
jgi:hypothetical protein